MLNKIDLLREEEVQRLVKLFTSECMADRVIPVAAKYGVGVQEVKEWASQQLKEGPSLYPKVSAPDHEKLMRPYVQQYLTHNPACCLLNHVPGVEGILAINFTELKILQLCTIVQCMQLTCA